MISVKKVDLLTEIEQVSSLAREIWQDHYTPIIGVEQVEYMLSNFQSVRAIEQQIQDGYEYYLLINNDIPVGYMSYGFESNYIFLSKIYVLSSSRGKGIGKKAIQYVVKSAEKSKLNFIRLTVNKNNTQSIAAYQKIGFIVASEQVKPIGNGFVMDDYVLELCIKTFDSNI
jgi:ribosomal protein S18 acetylase RimI-like enzyme